MNQNFGGKILSFSSTTKSRVLVSLGPFQG